MTVETPDLRGFTESLIRATELLDARQRYQNRLIELDNSIAEAGPQEISPDTTRRRIFEDALVETERKITETGLFPSRRTVFVRKRH